MSHCSAESRVGWKSLAVAIMLTLLVTVPHLPASAQATSADVSITLDVQPPSPFFFEDIHAVLTLEGTGDPIDAVTFETFGDCDGLFVGPNEVSGDGDATLEIGEQWTYTCDTMAFHGVINIELSGMSGGETVTAAGGIEFGAPFPIGGTLVSSTTSAEVDEVVTWTITVENLGSYPLIEVVAEARILYDGQTFPVPYDPMTGPVEVSGNGDANLDPGEIWEYSYSASIFADSRAEVSIAAAPDGAPLTRFGLTFESAVVAFDAAPPTTSPPSELPLTGSGSDAYLLPIALALLAGIGTVAATRITKPTGRR